MSESVLVTSAGSKQTLAVVRTLARSGYDVSTVGSLRFCQSFYSRYCSTRYRVPDPADRPDAFISELQSILSADDYDILLPVRAADTIVIARHRDTFEDTIVATDSFENIQLAHDKEKATEHAKDHGVPIPETFCPTTEAELEEAATKIEYPAVVKLRKTSASTGLRYVNSREELLSTYSIDGSGGMAVDYSRPLIQEFVPGEIHDVCVLFEDGELKNALTQKRLRMFPASGGAGVVNVTTDRQDLVELVEQLLAPLDWTGVAQVEFMDGEDVQEPKLIEINPKIWGTVELSIAAGIDFPQCFVEMVLDKSSDDGRGDYERGLHFIWYEGGLLGNIYESKGIFKPLREIEALRQRNSETNIESSDPVPHMVRIPQLATLSAKHLLERWK